MKLKTKLRIYAGSGNRSSLVPEIVTIHLTWGESFSETSGLCFVVPQVRVAKVQ